jgi:hypothetical protein
MAQFSEPLVDDATESASNEDVKPFVDVKLLADNEAFDEHESDDDDDDDDNDDNDDSDSEDEPVSRRNKRKSSSTTLTLDQLRPFFERPVSQAAKELGVCAR